MTIVKNANFAVSLVHSSNVYMKIWAEMYVMFARPGEKSDDKGANLVVGAFICVLHQYWQIIFAPFLPSSFVGAHCLMTVIFDAHRSFMDKVELMIRIIKKLEET